MTSSQRAELKRRHDACETEFDVADARMTWTALSAPQVVVMRKLFEGRALTRASWSASTYNAVGLVGTEQEAIASICRIATVRALMARGLVESTNLSDEMKRFVLSQRGKFVIKIVNHNNQPGDDT